MDLKKAECKTVRLLLFKKRKGSLVSSLLNTNDPVFCTLLFSGTYFGPNFFQGHKPTHVFKRKIVGAD